MQRFLVRVPATSANLGPGFDSLGMAFELFNDFTVTASESLQFSGDIAGPTDETNLFALAFRAVQREIGAEGNVATEFSCAVPAARGLGSSSTLIVAGAVAANELYQAGLSHRELLQLCNAIEGHPDNVAPALLGGLTASFVEEGRAYSERVSVCARFHFAALIPKFELRTRESRAVLPAQVAFADASFNIAHAGALVLALHSGDAETVAAAMRDRLHQPYRLPLIAGQAQVREIAAAHGALASVISGAGPTLLTVWDGAVPTAFSAAIAACELAQQWEVRELPVAEVGARCLKTELPAA